MKLCTTNLGKIAEFGSLLTPIGIKLEPIINLNIPETGSSFEENAKQKAFGYASQIFNSWILAEDSGLCIPALDYLPGPWSARFCELYEENVYLNKSKKEIDELNNKKVLSLMEDIPENQRGAYFTSCIIVINPQKEIAFFTQEFVSGWISKEIKGSEGFGYDPIFISPESFGKTWAELDSVRKDLISHRSKAIWNFMAWICSTNQEVS